MLDHAVIGLLLTNAHLIPPELFNDAGRLVEHYDVWLEEFENRRNSENPNLESEFVYAGPKGFPFPRDAEDNFKKKYDEYWNELYGSE